MLIDEQALFRTGIRQVLSTKTSTGGRLSVDVKKVFRKAASVLVGIVIACAGCGPGDRSESGSQPNAVIEFNFQRKSKWAGCVIS